MKYLFPLFIALFSFPAFSKGNKWLKSFDLFNQASYYKSQVFTEHTWSSFYQLPDIHKSVNTDSFDLHLLNACLFFACNKLRAQHHLLPFKMDEKLKRVSSVHSYQMSIHHFFDHFNTFEPALKEPEDRFFVYDITFSYYAENCHKEYMDDDEISYIKLAQQIIESLYNSPAHKKSMLNKVYTYGAAGAALERTNDGIYLLVTQNFYNN